MWRKLKVRIGLLVMCNETLPLKPIGINRWRRALIAFAGMRLALNTVLAAQRSIAGDSYVQQYIFI
jgi:hypothetical protein